MKILIVEDEFVSRKKMEKLLTSLGYEMIIAEDGEHGLKIWKEERPRIVITDWIMPGLNGTDLCKIIRESEGSLYTYIIIVTAKNEMNDLIEGMEAGADDFITKPFVKEELAVRIKAGIRKLESETRDLVIFSLAKLVESRDPETGKHVERIRHYSKTLAVTLSGMPDPLKEIDYLFIENIFLTSPLHDIGKVGIPDYILSKPGKFDNREFEIMKTHCRIGFNTLNDALHRYPKVEYLRMSAEIALSHHEKFDGEGYPNQLKGAEIPISARIVALADVYDALVSKRIYKNIMSHDSAKSIIVNEKGKHFDPKIVDAFLQSEKTFIEILNSFNDHDDFSESKQ